MRAHAAISHIAPPAVHPRALSQRSAPRKKDLQATMRSASARSMRQSLARVLQVLQLLPRHHAADQAAPLRWVSGPGAHVRSRHWRCGLLLYSDAIGRSATESNQPTSEYCCCEPDVPLVAAASRDAV